ncbi:flagella basal body P-ring formation protein FlgA [Marinobacter salinus]|uniref:Flagella basal body P-ring formation protein FlgA n=1 Tax=Marinobacter salinus TaxID=1874317 RepID=A0A1D9GK43_9GAMM|nr:flagellar basal body P-ring formation chaperone FlgA [Marinobacter salinus]AOY87865.1 flagella basal body P-ring formation protein FlgA [Marinobacter salinus]
MRTTIYALTLLMSSFSAFAGTELTATQVHEAAVGFLEIFAKQQAANGYKVSFETGSIDDRLSLAHCLNPLSVEFTGDPWKSTRPSLQVACESERPWRLFVTASVSITGPALVAARPLTRGERVTKDMVTTDTVVINATRRGIMRQAQDVVGMEVRRPVNSGSLITPDLLAAPDAVERGDHVIITAKSGSFSVSTRGKALASASVGEQVLVENLVSARTVKANVVAPGRVEIPM